MDNLGEDILINGHSTGTYYDAPCDCSFKMIVTAREDRTVRAWDATTDAAITSVLEYDEVIQEIAFVDDGEVARLTGSGGSEWTLDMHGDNRPAADLENLAWLLLGAQIDPARGPLPLEPDVLKRNWERMLGKISE